MMTRRDYISTSTILNQFYKDSVTVEQDQDFDVLVHSFADMFAADNERFLRERFIDAAYEV
jgi:hypothetical protein